MTLNDTIAVRFIRVLVPALLYRCPVVGSAHPTRPGQRVPYSYACLYQQVVGWALPTTANATHAGFRYCMVGDAHPTIGPHAQLETVQIRERATYH
jgi:hypothetical protein